MKKIIKSLLMVSCITMALLLVPAVNTYAKEKANNAVTYTLKDGVLIIKGKGKMPKSMTFKKNKKIKKVVIKKGVKSIPKKAFYECSNLKEVKIAKTVKRIGAYCFYNTKIEEITIPKAVKVIGDEAIAYCKNLKSVTLPGDFDITYVGWTNNIMVGSNSIDTVKFNTNYNTDIANRCSGRKWIVLESDPNYKSIDGVIYTKDGKEIVIVPKDLAVLNVAEGCEIFDFNSIFYETVAECSVGEAHCDKLSKVILPESIKKIESEEYYFEFVETNLKEFTVNSKSIETESVIALVSSLKQVYKYGIFKDTYTFADINTIAEILPERIKKEGVFFILDENVLLGYEGNEETVIVPEYIKVIADKAFYSKKCKKVVLPEGIEKIGAKAFYECEDLEEINLPTSLKEIDSYAFAETGLKKVDIPFSIEVWGESIFKASKLKEAILPNEMKVVPAYLFDHALKLEKVNVPENLEEIGAYAFWTTKVDVQAFLNCESLTKIGNGAFGGVYWSTLTIPDHIKEIERYAFEKNTEDQHTVIIQGANFTHNNHTFMIFNNIPVILQFETDPSKYFTELEINPEVGCGDKKTSSTELEWLKVKGVDGYKIVISSNEEFTKNVKKMKAKKNQTSLTVDISRKWEKVYVKIRPYKIVDSEKVYGQWTIDYENVY